MIKKSKLKDMNVISINCNNSGSGALMIKRCALSVPIMLVMVGAAIINCSTVMAAATTPTVTSATTPAQNAYRQSFDKAGAVFAAAQPMLPADQEQNYLADKYRPTPPPTQQPQVVKEAPMAWEAPVTPRGQIQSQQTQQVAAPYTNTVDGGSSAASGGGTIASQRTQSQTQAQAPTTAAPAASTDNTPLPSNWLTPDSKPASAPFVKKKAPITIWDKLRRDEIEAQKPDSTATASTGSNVGSGANANNSAGSDNGASSAKLNIYK
jgi:hypothetical protein